MDVPVPFMQEQKIVIGLPEVKMDQTEFVIGIPEFTMKLHEIKFHLPEFTLKDIKVESEKAKARGEQLKEDTKARLKVRVANFQETAKAELGVEVAALYDCFREQLQTGFRDGTAQYDSFIAGTRETLTTMASKGVPQDNEGYVKTLASLKDMENKRKEFEANMTSHLAELDTQQKEAVDKMLGSISMA